MSDKYESNSQQRVLKVMFALAGNEIRGLEPTAIAKGLAIAPSAVTRDLANLVIAGVAEKMDNGAYRLTPKIVQVAIAFSDELNKAQTKLSEIGNRYTRTPR